MFWKDLYARSIYYYEYLNEFKKKDSMNVIEIKFEPENYYLASSLIKDSKFIPKRFSKYLRGLHLLGVANYI